MFGFTNMDPSVKPDLGTPVNPTHALFAGPVTGLWLFHAGMGTAAIDHAAAGVPMALGGSAGWGPTPPPGGVALNLPGTTDYAQATNAADLYSFTGTAPFSAIVRYTPGTSLGTYVRLISVEPSSNAGWSLGVGGSSNLYVLRQSATDFFEAGSIVAARPVVAAITYDGATLRLLQDGRSVGTPKATTASLSTTTARLRLGSSEAGAAGAKGQYDWAIVLPYAAPAGLLQALAAEPYAWLQAPPVRRFYGVAAGGGGTGTSAESGQSASEAFTATLGTAGPFAESGQSAAESLAATLGTTGPYAESGQSAAEAFAGVSGIAGPFGEAGQAASEAMAATIGTTAPFAEASQAATGTFAGTVVSGSGGPLGEAGQSGSEATLGILGSSAPLAESGQPASESWAGLIVSTAALAEIGQSAASAFAGTATPPVPTSGVFGEAARAGTESWSGAVVAALPSTGSYFPADHFAPSYFTPYYFPGTPFVPIVVVDVATGLRDWDVLSAIRDLLQSTNAFDGVHLSAEPEDWGRSSSEARMAVVLPDGWDDTDEWDDGSGVSTPRHVTYGLSIHVRMADPELRDREIDRLSNLAQVTLDGVSIAGLTLPGLTKLRRGKYRRAAPPERSKLLAGEFTYLVHGFGGHDLTE